MSPAIKLIASAAAIVLTSAASQACAGVTVALTAPANGATVNAPVTLSATASATNGYIVSKVEFFDGSTVIGTDPVAPYSMSWTNASSGGHTLTAKATATKKNAPNQTATSSAVNITVNLPPQVTLTSPPYNANYGYPAAIPASASASDSDGTMSRVEFWVYDFVLGTSTVTTVTVPPYSATLNPGTPEGFPARYEIEARAYDNQGATASSFVWVTVSINEPPLVNITNPTANSVFTGPASLTVSASATDSDGSVTQVEFFANGTAIGTATSAPFSISWPNVAAGNYSLTARATDNSSGQTTSAPVNITVNTPVAQLYYIETDHLNTPRLIANQAGTTVWRWDQGEPFGNDVPNNNPSGAGAFDFPLRFPGQYFDRETNLAYNYFRDYDPGLGRYAQSDLIGLKGGINTYGFAIENPMQHVDLLGLYVSVCYYPNFPTHIGFAVEGEIQTQGFYPVRPKAPIDKGKIALDPMDEPRECKTIPTTPDQDRCLVNCRKRRTDNPGRYNGATRQCTDFVRDCALECGVPIGNNGGPFPNWLFKGIPGSSPGQ